MDFIPEHRGLNYVLDRGGKTVFCGFSSPPNFERLSTASTLEKAIDELRNLQR